MKILELHFDAERTDVIVGPQPISMIAAFNGFNSAGEKNSLAKPLNPLQ